MSVEAASRAIVLGCAGPALSESEMDFFREADPFGFILFARNCETAGQIRALIGDLRRAVGRPDAPVLIDQEGGRVARLPSPEWARPPSQGQIGHIDATLGSEIGDRAAWVHGALIGSDLAALGVSIDCAPVLDLKLAGQSSVVGDRGFSDQPDIVARLGRGVMQGLMDAGILPAIKHLPGHGRALADSHVSMPVVTTDLDTLGREDFAPFRALRDAPLGLTAHVCFSAIDDEHPATLSERVIADIIRGEIGFDGLLFSDDLSMGALQGDVGSRAARSLAAGCDIALHCNGSIKEMEAVVAAVPRLSADAAVRWDKAILSKTKKINDISVLKAELESLLIQAGPL